MITPNALAQLAGAPQENGRPQLPRSTWQPIELAPIVAGIAAGTIIGPTPSLLPRTDGVCLLYPGEPHSLAGEPEAGKGWLALAEAARLILAGRHVLYLDFEDTAASIVGRLLGLGAGANAIAERFTYVQPADPLTPATLALLHPDGRTYTLAVIDGLSEAYALLGLDPYSNVDAAKFLAALPRPLAARGPAVLLIDHVVKDATTRGRYALGAQHKLAGVAVAYSAHVIKAPSRSTPGTIKLKVEKDRHGHVRGHAQAGVIALAQITPENDGGRVTVTLEPPDTSADTDGAFRPTTLMEKVSRHVEQSPGESSNAIRKAVPGKATFVDVALHQLVAEEYVERRRESQTHRHYSSRPYRALDDPQYRVPTASQPRPDAVSEDRVPTSPPIGDADAGHGHTRHSDHVPELAP